MSVRSLYARHPGGTGIIRPSASCAGGVWPALRLIHLSDRTAGRIVIVARQSSRSAGSQAADEEGEAQHAIAMGAGVHDLFFDRTFNVFLDFVPFVSVRRVQRHLFPAMGALRHPTYSFPAPAVGPRLLTRDGHLLLARNGAVQIPCLECHGEGEGFFLCAEC